MSGPQCKVCSGYHRPYPVPDSCSVAPDGVFRVITAREWYDLCLKAPEEVERAKYIVRRIEEICESADGTFSSETVDMIWLNSKTFKPRSGTTFRKEEGGLAAYRQAIVELKAKVGM